MAEKEPIPKELLKILACPVCKSSLKCSKDKKMLICAKCGLKYPIKEGIPILLAPKKVKEK